MSFLERQNAATETILLGVSLFSLNNADGTAMDATGGAGKFSISSGGFGVGTVEVLSELANGNTKTDDLILSIVLGDNFQKTAYTTGAKLLSLKIEHKTDPIANTTSSLDAEVYESDGNGGVVGSDLVTSGPFTNNSTTWIEQEFTITPTVLEPGDEMIVIIRAIIDDSAGASNAQAHIGKITFDIGAKM